MGEILIGEFDPNERKEKEQPSLESRLKARITEIQEYREEVNRQYLGRQGQDKDLSVLIEKLDFQIEKGSDLININEDEEIKKFLEQDYKNL